MHQQRQEQKFFASFFKKEGLASLNARCCQVTDPEQLRLAADDRFPNAALPALIYRQALPGAPDAMEKAFAAQGWAGAWRNGIYTFHHFHSTAHEVLGIAAGRVSVCLGGPSGQEVMLQAGDVVVIPAGVAHRNTGQSADLLVVGAYPGGDDVDTLRGDPAELAMARRNMEAARVPAHDPVPGQNALVRLWAAG